MGYVRLSLRLIARTEAAVMVARADQPRAPGVWVPLSRFHDFDARTIASLPAHALGTHELKLDESSAREKGLIAPPPAPGASLFGETLP